MRWYEWDNSKWSDLSLVGLLKYDKHGKFRAIWYEREGFSTCDHGPKKLVSAYVIYGTKCCILWDNSKWIDVSLVGLLSGPLQNKKLVLSTHTTSITSQNLETFLFFEIVTICY